MTVNKISQQEIYRRDRRAFAEMIVALAVTKSTVKNNLTLQLNLTPEQWQRLLDKIQDLADLKTTIQNEAGRQELSQTRPSQNS